MSRESGIAIVLLFLLVFLSASVLSITLAQARQYHLDQEWVKIWINQDGSIDLFYNISITLDSGPDINYILVGQPKGDFTIGNATDQYGRTLQTKDGSSGSDYRVQVSLFSPLTTGQTIWFTLITNVAGMIYQDSETNVGMLFRPTWWSEATVSDLRVSIVLPPGVAQNQIATSVNWDNVQLEYGRWAVIWERTDLAPNQQYDFGVSFPKEYVQVYIGAGRVHNLNTGLNYKTIQEAMDVNETLNGHAIFVDSGTYFERITVRKSISLVGENKNTTIIDGNMSGTIIVVWADFVTIRGFTVQNSGSFLGLPSGIEVDIDSWNCTIIDNIIVSNKGGISLLYAGNHTVANNTISSNLYGMNIVYSQNNTIFNNNFMNNSQQVFITGEINSWDNGFPAGGNYWSDYKQRYPNAKEVDNSGIWDTPYRIDNLNVDHYPLVPEFPSRILLLFSMAATTLLVMIFYKRRRLTLAL